MACALTAEVSPDSSDFPCTLTWYQQMTYEGDANTFYNYANNVLTQTIGSNTVQVCRAGVCTNTIPF
jgi:hypothetical protein